MKQIFFLLIVISIWCCSDSGDESGSDYNVNELDVEIGLYHVFPDSFIRYPNELYIVNSTYDTTIYETGIFTSLKYDFPLSTPDDLISSIRCAIKFESLDSMANALMEYKNALRICKEHEDAVYRGDGNGFFETKVNSSILCSYANEKLGNLDYAIEELQPWMSNSEAYGSKIVERYIKLCIEKYGIKEVKGA